MSESALADSILKSRFILASNEARAEMLFSCISYLSLRTAVELAFKDGCHLQAAYKQDQRRISAAGAN